MKENYRNSLMNYVYPLESLPSNNFFRPINITINSFRLPVKPIKPIDICYEKETSLDIETIKFHKLDPQLIIELINNLHLTNLSIYKQSKIIKNNEHIYYIKEKIGRAHV